MAREPFLQLQRTHITVPDVMSAFSVLFLSLQSIVCARCFARHSVRQRQSWAAAHIGGSGIVAPPCRKNVNMTFKEGALCVCVCLWTKQAHYYTLRMIRPLKTWGRSWPCVSSLASLTYKGRDSQSVQHTVCSARKSHCWIWWKQWKSGKQYEFATYLWCQCKAVLLKC